MRYSLKTILVCILIFALGLSFWIVSQRLQDATGELQAQRDELGHLNVADANKINFIMVPQHEDKKWRWRMQLPAGRKYNLCFQTIDITDDGYPQTPNSTFFVDDGEPFTLTILCHRDQQDRWKLNAMTTKGHSQNLGFLGPIHNSWFEGKRTAPYRVNGRGKTTSVDAQGPAQLMRLRIEGSGDALSDRGLLVWIAEASDR